MILGEIMTSYCMSYLVRAREGIINLFLLNLIQTKSWRFYAFLRIDSTLTVYYRCTLDQLAVIVREHVQEYEEQWILSCLFCNPDFLARWYNMRNNFGHKLSFVPVNLWAVKSCKH